MPLTRLTILLGSTPFLAKADWPADLKVPRGDANAVIKRYSKGDISSGDPQFIPVAPQTESMVCPSTTIVRLRQELVEMQEVLKGDAMARTRSGYFAPTEPK